MRFILLLCFSFLFIPTAFAETLDNDADFQKFLKSARAVPYSVDDKVVGMRLFAIQEDSIWAKAGIINGDVLKEINGKATSNAENFVSGFGEIYRNKTSEHKFKVGRANKDITLVYKGK